MIFGQTFRFMGWVLYIFMYHTYASTCKEITNKLAYNIAFARTGLAIIKHASRDTWPPLFSGTDGRGGTGSRLLGPTGLLPFEQSGSLPLLHTEQIRERVDAENLRGKVQLSSHCRDIERYPYIEDDKHDEDPNVPPPVRILNIEVVLEILVRRAKATKLALRGRAGVRDVSSVGGDVPSEVLRTSLARRWIDVTVLDVGTIDLLSTES